MNKIKFDSILHTIKKNLSVASTGADDTIIAATSGGVDSTAMLLMLAEGLRRNFFKDLYACHIDHRLRPGAEVKERENLKLLCDRYGVKFLCGTADVPSDRIKGESTEQAARRLRYKALQEITSSLLEKTENLSGKIYIATGHTADDQAETVLLRMLRGSGPRGLSAILPRAGNVVRPILTLCRQDMNDILHYFGASAVEDESNNDTVYDRNKLRKAVMPPLMKEFPAARSSLCHIAAVQKQIADFLVKQALEFIDSNLITYKDETGSGPGFQTEKFYALPEALREQVVDIISEKLNFKGLNRRHIEMINQGESSGDGYTVRLPEDFLFRKAGEKRDSTIFFYREILPSTTPVSIEPGQKASFCGWEFEFSTTDKNLQLRVTGPTGENYNLKLSAEYPHFPFKIRVREPGDRIRPKGLGGSKKLSDIMIDAHIPKHRRGSYPVVLDSTGTILWVTGLAIHENAGV